MPVIRVYFHAACMNHWRQIVAQLEGMMDASGLYDAADELILSTVGEPGKLRGLVGDKWSHEKHPLPVEAYEYPTLERLWRDCQENPEGSVLYVHTKGASCPGKSPQRDRWRRYMAHYVIGHWSESVDLLDEGYEAVGTEYRPNDVHFLPHFAGNFWWARADYVATLAKPEANDSRHHPRFPAEMWILSGRPEMFSWFQSDPEHGYRRNWSTYKIHESTYRRPIGESTL